MIFKSILNLFSILKKKDLFQSIVTQFKLRARDYLQKLKTKNPSIAPKFPEKAALLYSHLFVDLRQLASGTGFSHLQSAGITAMQLPCLASEIPFLPMT